MNWHDELKPDIERYLEHYARLCTLDGYRIRGYRIKEPEYGFRF